MIKQKIQAQGNHVRSEEVFSFVISELDVDNNIFSIEDEPNKKTYYFVYESETNKCNFNNIYLIATRNHHIEKYLKPDIAEATGNNNKEFTLVDAPYREVLCDFAYDFLSNSGLPSHSVIAEFTRYSEDDKFCLVQTGHDDSTELFMKKVNNTETKKKIKNLYGHKESYPLHRDGRYNMDKNTLANVSPSSSKYIDEDDFNFYDRDKYNRRAR